MTKLLALLIAFVFVATCFGQSFDDIPQTKLVSVASSATMTYKLFRDTESGLEYKIHRSSVCKVRAIEPAYRTRNGTARPEQRGTGGVIYSDAEHSIVVTNSHVIRADPGHSIDRIVCETIHGSCIAKVLFENPRYHQDGNDIALLWIRTPPGQELVAIPLAESSSPNQHTFSAGHAHGGPIVTRAGVVGSVQYRTGSTQLVETTAGVVDGESGSPLVNAAGELIAVINTSDGRTAQGVPASQVAEAVQQYCVLRGGILQAIGQRILHRAAIRNGVSQVRRPTSNQGCQIDIRTGQPVYGSACNPAPNQIQFQPQPSNNYIEPPSESDQHGQVSLNSPSNCCGGSQPGNPGRPGATGPAGPKGADGRDGKDAEVTQDLIRDIVNAVVDQVPPGKDGKDGEDGESPEVDYDRLAEEVIARLPPIYPMWIDKDGKVIDEIKGGVRLGQTLPLRVDIALKRAAVDARP